MEEKIYIMMNKPESCVCSSVSDSHKTVYSLLPQELQNLLQAKRGHKLHTVGRLDCDTTGLLLFTTDGYFSNHITRHENSITKTYQVQLQKPVDSQNQEIYVRKFWEGLSLPPEKKAPEQFVNNAILTFLTPSTCTVTITQGVFHQVKRMFLAVNNQVTKLHRTKIGPYQLPENLKSGQWQYFVPEL